jgi:hypothetical protein
MKLSIFYKAYILLIDRLEWKGNYFPKEMTRSLFWLCLFFILQIKKIENVESIRQELGELEQIMSDLKVW